MSLHGLCFSSCLDFCPDLCQWRTVAWKCKIKRTFFPPSAFGHVINISTESTLGEKLGPGIWGMWGTWWNRPCCLGKCLGKILGLRTGKANKCECSEFKELLLWGCRRQERWQRSPKCRLRRHVLWSFRGKLESTSKTLSETFVWYTWLRISRSEDFLLYWYNLYWLAGAENSAVINTRPAALWNYLGLIP